MAKKSKSKPMKEILERLCLFKYITVVTFEEEVILNEPVENWPLCDCLISFHSKGEWREIFCHLHTFTVSPRIACVIGVTARQKPLLL